MHSIIHPTWVKTRMIEDLLKVRKFNDVLLEPQPVADAIVEQILKGESGQVILPKSFNISAPLVRAFPSWLQEKTRSGKAGLLDGLEKYRK
jgi:all-trans-retinol dehydrogenase (NAD+)